MSQSSTYQPDADEGDHKLLKVGSGTSPQAAAAAITKSITDSRIYPEVRAIGHGAVGQATKAIAIASGTLAAKAINLAVIVGFETVEDRDGKDISAMVFRTFAR